MSVIVPSNYYGYTIEEINQIITKIFNYYNGKINPLNQAVLNIEWVGSIRDAFGSTNLPNLVAIFPKKILLASESKEEFVFNIVNTIIHELYHANQLVDNHIHAEQIRDDPLEAPVYIKTNNYMVNHIAEISWITNGVVNRDVVLKKCGVRLKASSYEYIETDILNHIINTILCTTRANVNSFDGVITPAIYDSIHNKSIEAFMIDMDGCRYTIIHNNKIVTDFDMFNSFILHTMSVGRIKNAGSTYIKLYRVENMYVLKISYKKVRFKMCEIINKAVLKEE